MVLRRGSTSAGDAAPGGTATSLLLVAAALLTSMVSLLVLGSLLVLAEMSILVRKAVLLASILLLALGQPHFVAELAKRLRVAERGSRFVSLGTFTSSLALLALGVLVSRTL